MCVFLFFSEDEELMHNKLFAGGRVTEMKVWNLDCHQWAISIEDNLGAEGVYHGWIFVNCRSG